MPNQTTAPTTLPETTDLPASRPKPNGWRWAVRLGGTGLLLFFLWRLKLDLGQVWAELVQANLWYIMLSVLLVFPFIALKSWRWQLILADLGISLPFGRAYRIYALGLAAGSFTPGQSGDFIKAWYLRNEGHSLGAAFLAAVLDRLFDVAMLVMLAASGLLVLGADFASVLPGLMALLVLTLLALAVLSIPAARTRLLKIALRLSLRKQSGSPSATESQPAQAISFVPVFFITLAASGLALLRIWLLALALGLNLDLMQTVAASSLATVAALVPISVGGIGARDLALVGILGKLGYSSEKAVGLSTFILLLTLVNLIAGYLIWYTRPKEK